MEKLLKISFCVFFLIGCDDRNSGQTQDGISSVANRIDEYSQITKKSWCSKAGDGLFLETFKTEFDLTGPVGKVAFISLVDINGRKASYKKGNKYTFEVGENFSKDSDLTLNLIGDGIKTSYLEVNVNPQTYIEPSLEALRGTKVFKECASYETKDIEISKIDYILNSLKLKGISNPNDYSSQGVVSEKFEVPSLPLDPSFYLGVSWCHMNYSKYLGNSFTYSKLQVMRFSKDYDGIKTLIFSRISDLGNLKEPGEAILYKKNFEVNFSNFSLSFDSLPNEGRKEIYFRTSTNEAKQILSLVEDENNSDLRYSFVFARTAFDCREYTAPGSHRKKVMEFLDEQFEAKFSRGTHREIEGYIPL